MTQIQTFAKKEPTETEDALFDKSGIVARPMSSQDAIEDMSMINGDQTHFMNQTENMDLFGEDGASAPQQQQF